MDLDVDLWLKAYCFGMVSYGLVEVWNTWIRVDEGFKTSVEIQGAEFERCESIAASPENRDLNLFSIVYL